MGKTASSRKEPERTGERKEKTANLKINAVSTPMGTINGKTATKILRTKRITRPKKRRVRQMNEIRFLKRRGQKRKSNLRTWTRKIHQVLGNPTPSAGYKKKR